MEGDESCDEGAPLGPEGGCEECGEDVGDVQCCAHDRLRMVLMMSFVRCGWAMGIRTGLFENLRAGSG